MSVKPPAAGSPPPAPRTQPAKLAPGADRSFRGLLAAARADGAAFGEVLRLQLMRSALAPAEEEPVAGFSLARELLAALPGFRPGTGQEADTVPASPTAGLEHYRRQAAAAPPPLDAVVRRAADRFGLAPELVRAVIRAESGFDPRAVSPAGAQGLMQLMPATARELGVNDPFDPQQNVMAGSRYLRQMLDRYDGDLDAALAAYNWGPGNLDRSDGRLPRETRAYVARVRRYLEEAG